MNRPVPWSKYKNEQELHEALERMNGYSSRVIERGWFHDSGTEINVLAKAKAFNLFNDRSNAHCLSDVCKSLFLFSYLVIEHKNLEALPEIVQWQNWTHRDNERDDHARRGYLYWNLFWTRFIRYHDREDTYIGFGDSPDFCGRFPSSPESNRTYVFRGYIGAVGLLTFAICLKHMRKGDLWITFDGTNEYILEALIDVCELSGRVLKCALSGVEPTADLLMDLI